MTFVWLTSPSNLVLTPSKKMNVADAVPPELDWPDYNGFPRPFSQQQMLTNHQSTPIGSARIAVIYRDEEGDRFRFIENVSVNRGGNMKIFTDADEAIDWLTSSP